MPIKLFYTTLLFATALGAAFGQERVTDSLKNSLVQTRQDTSRVLLLTELAANYQFFKSDTAIELAHQAIASARRIRFSKGEIRALTRLGEIHRNRGEYSSSLDAYLKALRLSRQTNYSLEEANTLSYTAIVYLELGEYRQGLEYLFQAQRTYQRNAQPLPAFGLSNIGHAYERLGKLDSALYYQQQALVSPTLQVAYLQSRTLRALILIRLGNIQKDQGNTKKALRYYQKAFQTASGAGDLLNRARSQFQIADVYHSLQQLDSSLYYAQRAFQDAQQLAQKTTLLSASRLLAQLYRGKNKLDSAFYFQEVAMGVKDSLFGSEKFRRLQVLTLSEQQQVQRLQQQQERSEARMQRASLLAIVSVFLLIALFLWRSNQQQQLANRTLSEKKQEIEAQRNTLEQTITELKDTQAQLIQKERIVALRAQMNPHFIFNCLNSIKLYTLQNNSDQASDFLTKFAKLIRLVLENSRCELVTLRNELEALQLYIELEAMRFKDKLRYQLVVSPEIDPQYLRIPPLLLQPFVENAIWHGLMHKPEGGTVTVEVRQPEESLLHIEITDDGVGRERAGELKSKSAGQHKSFGMQVTADRIRMINQLYNIQTKTQIVDLVDSFGEPAGTKVVLEIPV